MLCHAVRTSRLTLPSRGRPQASFACLRPPLMSNVGRHLERRGTHRSKGRRRAARYEGTCAASPPRCNAGPCWGGPLRACSLPVAHRGESSVRGRLANRRFGLRRFTGTSARAARPCGGRRTARECSAEFTSYVSCTVLGPSGHPSFGGWRTLEAFAPQSAVRLELRSISIGRGTLVRRYGTASELLESRRKGVRPRQLTRRAA